MNPKPNPEFSPEPVARPDGESEPAAGQEPHELVADYGLAVVISKLIGRGIPVHFEPSVDPVEPYADNQGYHVVGMIDMYDIEKLKRNITTVVKVQYHPTNGPYASHYDAAGILHLPSTADQVIDIDARRENAVNSTRPQPGRDTLMN